MEAQTGLARARRSPVDQQGDVTRAGSASNGNAQPVMAGRNRLLTGRHGLYPSDVHGVVQPPIPHEQAVAAGRVAVRDQYALIPVGNMDVGLDDE